MPHSSKEDTKPIPDRNDRSKRKQRKDDKQFLAVLREQSNILHSEKQSNTLPSESYKDKFAGLLKRTRRKVFSMIQSRELWDLEKMKESTLENLTEELLSFLKYHNLDRKDVNDKTIDLFEMPEDKKYYGLLRSEISRHLKVERVKQDREKFLEVLREQSNTLSPESYKDKFTRLFKKIEKKALTKIRGRESWNIEEIKKGKLEHLTEELASFLRYHKLDKKDVNHETIYLLKTPEDKKYYGLLRSEISKRLKEEKEKKEQSQKDGVQGLPATTVTDVQKNQGTEKKGADTENFIEMVLVQEALDKKGDIQKLGAGIQEGVSEATDDLKKKAEALQEAIKNVSTATEKTIEPALQSIKAASQDLEKTAKSIGNKALEMTCKTLTIIADFCLHLLRIVPTCFKKISLEFGHFIPNCKKVGLPAAMVGFLAGLISFAPSAFVQEFKNFKNSSKETIKSEKDHFGIFLARHHKLLHKDMESMQGVLKEWKHEASAQNAEEAKDVSKQTFSLGHSFKNVSEELRRRASELDADGAAVSRGPQSRKP